MIYCVEDDMNIRELVAYALKTSGYEAIGFENAAEFYKGLKDGSPDLILLDIMLPDEDGISILKKLRAKNEYKDIPVIMLTAKSTEYDKVKGLDVGADDYVTKPFGVMELISRIKAVLRRSQKSISTDMMVLGDIRLDIQKHEVTVSGKEVILTYKEFELLTYLMKNQGIVLSRDKILEVIWNYDYEGESRTVDVHIGSLRQKLGASGNMIETVRGVGYKMGNKE
ncbi:MAG: response regulator transcription factor [Clostridiales bacterium]|uniref:winged helix-turn-helix domain-containing protein n=1 Tax=Robinsoniella sp. TaxID=2496533 RepID=UPI002906F59E|nr:response regulator transcription factor [Clostridiales bacterium]MDU3238982.1 response regulator transcription factor [Clostridiales bacterium]